METVLKAMREFEKRNNMSVYFTMCSDGSCSVYEFWDNEELKNDIKTPELLTEYFNTFNYEKSDDGRCISPVVLSTPITLS